MRVTAKAKDEISEAKIIWYDEGRLNLKSKSKVKQSDVSAENKGADIQAPIK